MMRKAIFCLAVALTALTAKAQTNSNHLMVGVGTLYEKGLDATIAYEHGSKYHNAWEYFATGGTTITPGILASPTSLV